MTTLPDKHLAASRPTSRAQQRLLTMRLYRQAKFKGRTPKSWLIRFRKLVERGFANGYDHIKTGSRMSSSVADTLLSALESAASERAGHKRCLTLESLDRSAAGKKGGSVLADRKGAEVEAKIDAFRASHPLDRQLVAAKVARWWVKTHEGEPQRQQRTKAVRKLTRQLRRRKLAS